MQIYCRFNAIYLLLCFSFKNFIQIKRKIMEKIIIEHVDCVGITLDKFELTPSKKELIGISRVFIRTQEGKILGYFKVYEDETIEFVNETNS